MRHLFLGALTVLAAALFHTIPRTANAAAPQPGDLSPQFQATDMSSFRWSSSQMFQEGKTVVLAFWSKRSPPSLRLLAALEELYLKHKPAGLMVFGVEGSKTSFTQVGEDLEQIKNVQVAPTFPIVPDPSGSLSATFGVTAVPAAFVIHQREVITARFLDFPAERKADLVEAIERIFNPPSPRSVTAPLAAEPVETPPGEIVRGEAPTISQADRNRKVAGGSREEEFEKNRYFGDFYFNRQEYEKAVSHYAKCIEIKPDSIPIRMKMGEVFVKIKQYDKAREQWEEVLRINPGNLEADDNIRRLIRGDYRKMGSE